MTRLYLIRHGETTWNQDECIQGSADVPLNDAGERQMRLTSVYLKEALRREIEIYSSDLSRCVRSAELICMYHPGPDAAFSANLREVDFGYWTGRHVQEVRADPVARAAWDDMSIDYVWGDAESFALAHRRAEAAIADYVRGARVADIVVVTHGLIIQLLLSGWLCGSPASANRFSAANGSVSVVDFDGHHVVLRASNLRPAELFEYGERARAAIGVATTVRSEVQ